MVESRQTKRAADDKSFDGLLGALSVRLLESKAHNIDAEIRQALMEIGEHYGVDCVQLRRFSEDRSAFNLLHWWLRSNNIGLRANITHESIPWASSLLLRGEIAKIERRSEMPPEAAIGRAMMEEDELRAALLVPITVSGQIFGVFVLAHQEDRQWSDEIARESQLLGGALATAYERAQLYNALWTSEARLRAVVENQTEFIVRWLPDGTRTWVNERYCDFFHASRESLIGTSFLPLVVQADRQKILNKIEAMTPDSPTQTGDHQVLLPGGETGWQRWTDEGIFDASGKLIEIQSVGRDITEGKLAEQALLESEARYRDLVENTSDWIWEMNLDLKHTFSNNQLEVILGYTEDEVRELSLPQLMHPEDLKAVQKRLPEIVDSKSGWERWELRFRHKDGSYRFLQSNAVPAFDAEGNLRAFHGIDRDITESVTSREAVEKSEQKYRTVVESANDFIWMIDGERISDCNRKVEEIFGRERNELIGKTPWDTDISPVRQPDGSKSKKKGTAILKDVSSGNPRRLEWVHRKPDGTGIDLEISMTPIELTDGSQRILAVGRDITQAKLAQREIERRSEFERRLAGMSAELATTPEDETNALVERILASVGIDYRLDFISLWWIAGEHNEMERRAGWRLDPDDGQQRAPDLSNAAVMPWVTGLIRKGETVQIDDVDSLPDEVGVDRARWQKYGTRSVLGFPLRVQDSIGGAFFFASFKQRPWSEETVQELGLVANTVSGACVRHWAVEEILDSERNLARSQEAARVGNYSLEYDVPRTSFSPEGTVKTSAQFRELFGVEADASGETVLSRIHPDDIERVRHTIDEGFASGAPMHDEYRVVRPDGTVLHLEGRRETERDEKGRVKKFFGIAKDVTEEVEARERIASALAEIEKLKDQLQEENLYLREEIRAAHGFNRIIGDSARLRRALMAAEKVAPTDVPVLILGETGTGKELVAQSIHDLSGRKDNAMISVNCAALSKDLIESELFGHEKGAFTGAHSQRKGRFELADGGTLFLDEIGELQGELQAKLLRVLQTGDFERLGGSTTLRANVRLIAATNKDLQRAVDEGEFRADLFYRINSYPVSLPPLRERPEDIPALVEYLVGKHAKRMGKDIRSISARTIRHVTGQQWPGNVRELEGFVQRALISVAGPVLEYSESDESVPASLAIHETDPANVSTDLRDVERRHILKVLENTKWVIDGKRGAAAMMSIAPSTLRSKMKRLGIERN